MLIFHHGSEKKPAPEIGKITEVNGSYQTKSANKFEEIPFTWYI